MTVSEALESIRLNKFSHVVIHQRVIHGFELLGGGYPSKVISRFGEKEIIRADIFDNILHLYVK